MTTKDEARRRILQARRRLVSLSRRIHEHPELGFEEARACDWLTEELVASGFRVERDLAALPTAFAARAGAGRLHLAFCAEYDALPEIGHACGHNMIAAIAVGAGIGIASLADDLDLRVSILGTPAEELGNGKAILLERGAFDGVHAAMMVHPAPLDVLDPPLLAFAQFDVTYASRTLRANGLDEVDGPGSDAMTLAQVALGLLRGHLRPTDRVHGVVAPGATGDRVTGSFMTRARTIQEFREVHERVIACFEGAARATDTELRIVPLHAPYAEMRHESALLSLYRRNAEELGRVFPDLGDLLERGVGSTDMGNVSQVIPAIHPAIGVGSLPYANHQPEFAGYCIGPEADEALVAAAIALAWTAIDVARDGKLRRTLMAEADPDRDGHGP